jgi:2-oxoglutarate ferredoxin oxidoreductase subunit beta
MNEDKLEHPLHKYVRPGAFVTAACPGCGNGIVAQAMLRAIHNLDLSMDDFIFVSGIGCSAWIPSPYFHADVLHTTHGRPLAFATGVKFGLPEKHVVVISGDGDLVAIGGNHFIHAARRNLPVLCILVNNFIYGMTGGQVGPTTPTGQRTTTTPYGNPEPDFNIVKLAEGAGASFVARWTIYHARQLTRTLQKALQRDGFRLIEVITQCPTHVGRRAALGSSVQMIERFRDTSITVARAQKMSPQELEGKIVVGEIVDREGYPLMAEYGRLGKVEAV